MTNLDSILKSRDITLLTKVYMVKAMVFPVVMRRWELDHKEGWALKNWCFQTGRKRLLRVPWTARSNQFILKEINPEYSLEGLMLKLKLPYSDHLMQRANFTGKDPDAGKDWGKEEKGVKKDEMDGWHHWLNRHEFEQTLGDSEGQGSLECCSPWGHRVRYYWAIEQQQLYFYKLITCFNYMYFTFQLKLGSRELWTIIC